MPDDLLDKRSGHTQSVSRALSLLTKLAEEPEGLTFRNWHGVSVLHLRPRIACLPPCSWINMSVLKMGDGLSVCNVLMSARPICAPVMCVIWHAPTYGC